MTPRHWTPNVLVLGVGGLVGEAWMAGFLAGVEERTGIDFRRAGAYVGTSAGSIVAATLVAGVSPRRPAGGQGAVAHEDNRVRRNPAWRRARRASLAPAYAIANAARGATAPAMALARAALLASLPAGRQPVTELRRAIAQLDCRFDGRLRIVAVDQATGRRVVFGAPGAPSASVVDAVAASCAVPSIYPPVTIAGRQYVDGGVWSPSNLDAAELAAGDDVLCLLPTGSVGRSRQALLRVLGAALHGSTTALEIAEARRRGAIVRVVVPDARAADAMGFNPLDPSRGPSAVAEGFRQGLAWRAR